MRSNQFRVDLMCCPGGRFVPDQAFAMTSRGNEVGLAIAVYISDENIRGTLLIASNTVFLPGLLRIDRLLPPRKPISIGLDFRATRQIEASVAIHVADSQIVAEAGRVAIREDVHFPTLRRPRLGRYTE